MNREIDRRSAERDISVIIPTYQEAQNVPVLVSRLEEVLDGSNYEIIIVDDDSPDRTWEIANQLAQESHRVHSLRRRGERGLSSAVLAGMQIASGRSLVVMDADLQHDERIVPTIVAPILAGEADIVVGSREAEGGSYGDWNRWRRTVSWFGKQVASQLLGSKVSDPMSGFFAISRERYELVAEKVNPRGFKILLEFLSRGPSPRVEEVGYSFGNRLHGETKMTSSVAGAYVVAILDLFLGRVVSARFTAYALVGLTGILVRAAAYSVFVLLAMPFATLAAFEVSILGNYVLNNRFTFVDSMRRGSANFGGLILFHIVAFYGLAAQMGIAIAAGADGGDILDASLPIQAIGIVVATTGNYIGNRSLTWRDRRP